MKLFARDTDSNLLIGISKHLDLPLGDVIVGHFPDGETRVEIKENVRGEDVFVIQIVDNREVNHAWMELFILIDALKRSSAKSITAVLPYFGYARQDRKDRPRVPITSKLVANLLIASGVTRLLTLDLHAQQIQGFFDIPVDHLYASNVFFDHLKDRQITDDLVIVSPDVSGIKVADVWANHFNGALAIVAKRRNTNGIVSGGTIIGEVKGRQAIIVDDIVSTGSTIIHAAELLLKNGATRVIACVSHNLLADRIVAMKLKAAGIEELITTDSVKSIRQHGDLKLTIISVASLLGEAISCIHKNRSVSELFGKRHAVR